MLCHEMEPGKNKPGNEDKHRKNVWGIQEKKLLRGKTFS